MGNEIFVKIADQISNQLISLWKNNKTKDKTIMQLYYELLDKNYLPYQYNILSYIPERLSIKGYEIVGSTHFELKKY